MLTRSPSPAPRRSAASSARRLPDGQEAQPGARRQVAVHRFRGRRSRQRGRRAWWTRSGSTRARSAAPVRA
jgi:hypothetical protein